MKTIQTLLLSLGVSVLLASAAQASSNQCSASNSLDRDSFSVVAKAIKECTNENGIVRSRACKFIKYGRSNQEIIMRNLDEGVGTLKFNYIYNIDDNTRTLTGVQKSTQEEVMSATIYDAELTIVDALQLLYLSSDLCEWN